jgi:hypothetical protein
MTNRTKKTSGPAGKSGELGRTGSKGSAGTGRRKRGNTRGGSDTDRLKSVHLWPDEDERVVSEYRKEVFDGLLPESPYEHTLADNIVDISCDINRTRRLRGTILSNAVDEQFNNRVREMIRTRYGGKVEDFEKEVLDPKWDTERRRMAILGCMGMSMKDLVAEAYDGPVGSPRVKDKIDVLDNKIGDLEVRRRRLVADYEKLWDKNRKKAKDE